MAFTSIIRYTIVIVGLKLLLTVGTNMTTVFCVQRKQWFEIGKTVLKLLLMETEIETHTCKLLQNIGIDQ